ncbi:MAG: glycosyltransferase family 4 protein [Rhodothermales bacterium]
MLDDDMATVVIGRYPPPVDGQALATERLATLLEPVVPVVRINMEPPSAVGGIAPDIFHRGLHYLSLRRSLGQRLGQVPDATVLWPSISPDLPGHLRDSLITVPNFEPSQRIHAVVHRGNFHRLFESPLTRRTAMRLVDRLDGFVFLTDLLADRCARWIPKNKRFVVPNTIDDQIVFSDEEVGAKQQRRGRRSLMSVLFVGHMLPSKGYLDVLQGVCALRDDGENIEAHFVGGWSSRRDREAFFRRVEAEDLSRWVTHHGALSDRDRMKQLYREADALLLPTYYRNEAQPLVIIEALNSGTPVITTPHAGIPDMIQDKREGYFVPAADASALAEAVRQLRSVPTWRRASEAARETYVEQFAPAKVRERWLRLLRT